jgi:hypothetical protein
MIDSRATEQTIETVLKHYIMAALWTSVSPDEYSDFGEYLDAHFTADDIAPVTLEAMRADVAAFLNEAWEANLDLSPIEPEQIGHDFWLTRNHHGAGFWDRGLGELGERLTKMSEAYGEVDLYVGDDGMVYA